MLEMFLTKNKRKEAYLSQQIHKWPATQLHKINLGQTKKYDLIWFLHSFTYKQGENFIKQIVGDCKKLRKYKNKVEEIEKKNKNRIQNKFDSINPINQTNAN